MKIVSIYEFRDNLADYLSAVAKNDTSIVIKRFNKPLAVVSPYKKGEVDDFEEYFGFMRGGKDGTTYEDRVRRNKREREYVDALRKGIK